MNSILLPIQHLTKNLFLWVGPPYPQQDSKVAVNSLWPSRAIRWSNNHRFRDLWGTRQLSLFKRSQILLLARLSMLDALQTSMTLKHQMMRMMLSSLCSWQDLEFNSQWLWTCYRVLQILRLVFLEQRQVEDYLDSLIIAIHFPLIDPVLFMEVSWVVLDSIEPEPQISNQVSHLKVDSWIHLRVL